MLSALVKLYEYCLTANTSTKHLVGLLLFVSSAARGSESVWCVQKSMADSLNKVRSLCLSVPAVQCIHVVLFLQLWRSAGCPLFKDIVMQSKPQNREKLGRVGGERENMQPLTALSSVLYTCCQFKYFVLDLSGKYLTQRTCFFSNFRTTPASSLERSSLFLTKMFHHHSHPRVLLGKKRKAVGGERVGKIS